MAWSRHRFLMFMVLVPFVFGLGCASSGYDPPGTEPAAENSESFIPYLDIEFDVYNWSTTTWVEALRLEIVFLWNPPSDYQPGISLGYTVVTFSVNPGGMIYDIRMQEHFGQEELHTEALRCIESLISPRPLPDDFRDEQLQVEVKFQYRSNKPDIRY